MHRRIVIQMLTGALLLSGGVAKVARAISDATPMTLLSAPLELTGDWGGSPTEAAKIVLTRMREVCLSGVRLVSDRQPNQLRVDEHPSGPPAVWLHGDPANTAWVIVDIGGRDWCKLAYQFGHELGHVLCNSWRSDAKPKPPTQWLEEAMVEAFSIRGLGLLASSWEQRPPFAGDAPFAAAIRQYRANIIQNYGRQDGPDFARWFREKRAALEAGSPMPEGTAVLAILPELEGEIGCVEDLGAVNRWPERTGLVIEGYLAAWRRSCAEVGAPGRLPARLAAILGLG